MDETALSGMMFAGKLGLPLRVGGRLVSVSAEEVAAIEARLPPAAAGPAAEDADESDFHRARVLAYHLDIAERALTELAGRAGTLAWPPGVTAREEHGCVWLTEQDGRCGCWSSWFDAWRSLALGAPAAKPAVLAHAPRPPSRFDICTQADGSLRINGTHDVRSNSPDSFYVVRLGGAGGRDEIQSWHPSEEAALDWLRAELAGKHAALPPTAEQET